MVSLTPPAGADAGPDAADWTLAALDDCGLEDDVFAAWLAAGADAAMEAAGAGGLTAEDAVAEGEASQPASAASATVLSTSRRRETETDVITIESR